MSPLIKRIVTAVLVLALVVGVSALLAPNDTLAKGKPNKPPKCKWCDPIITLPDGTVCTLDACGFDCVYNCPLPF